MLKRIFKGRINEIHEKFKNEKVLIFDDMANFFGLESKGIWKVRGNWCFNTHRRTINFWYVENPKK